MTENEISRIIVDSALSLHKELGPGLLESVYEVTLTHELNERGIESSCQVSVPIYCKGHHFDTGFRADIIAQNKVIIEIKSVSQIVNIHKKQLLIYLKLSGLKLGLLLNFSEELMKNGIVRIANGL